MTLELDPADLTRVFGRPVATYQMEPIEPHLRIHSVTGGVYRVHADGRSVVVKVVRHGEDTDPHSLWLSGADPSHRNYWKREWLAFDSGLLDQLPGRLRAPRRLLTTQPSDRECWIWMEDVACRGGNEWSLEDFATAARDLGTVTLPDHEWLSRDWLRGWVDACAPLVDALAESNSLGSEVVAPLRATRERVLALWAARDELFTVLDAAPPTLVHCDLWATNLFACPDGTVAIDWSQIGIGVAAQDLDQMTLDTVWMPVRPDESLDALEQAILPAYQRGLGDAGYDVDASTLRRWYAAAAALHYPWMSGMVLIRSRQPDQVAGHESRWGRPYAQIVATRARVVERAVMLGEWALESLP